MNSRSEDNTVDEIESLLLAQKARIKKHSKEIDSNSSSINLTIEGNNFRTKQRKIFKATEEDTMITITNLETVHPFPIEEEDTNCHR